MRRCDCFPLAVLLLLAAVGATAQRPAAPPPRDTSARGQEPAAGIGGIRGRVLDNATGRALPKAKVTLSSDADASPPHLFTDATGQFAFVPLPPAHYTILVEKAGFARVRYGARTELDPPAEIDLTGGVHVEDIAVGLMKGAAIYGRVTDDFGDPVVGGQITLDALQMVGTSRRLVPAAHAIVETNDLGDYRIGDLPPGRYYVSVAGAGLGTLPSGMPREWERLAAWVRTYFPGATSVANAQPVTVAAGEERGGVDFSVRPFDRIHLAVTLNGLTTVTALRGGGRSNGFVPAGRARGRFGPQARLSFIPADEPDIVSNIRTLTVSGDGGPGSFTVNAGVDEGDWIVFARNGPNGAMARIRLASGDDAALSLDLVPGAKVSGRVVWDGARPPAMNATKIFVRGTGEEAAIPSDLLTPRPIAPRADGTFDIPELFGTVALDPTPPPGWTVKSILLGQRDLLDDPLVLESGKTVGGVQVVLSDQVASLTGTAAARDGSPAAGCAIALFPDATAARVPQRRMRLARADQHGRFRMRDIPSGAYRIAALADIDAATWMMPESLAALRVHASAVDVPQHGDRAIALTCQAGP